MSITPEKLQQAIQAAVAAAAHQWQEAAAQMQQEIGNLRTQVQATPTTNASLVDTRLLGKPESFDGGAGWKDWSVVFRSYASACSAPLGSLLERVHTLCCRTHILSAWRTDITHTHGSSICKKVCSVHVVSLSISPSPFSRFTRRLCCSLIVTFPAPHLCRVLFAPKSRSMRTPTRAARRLSKWQIQRTPQVMSPRCSTKTFLWTMT